MPGSTLHHELGGTMQASENPTRNAPEVQFAHGVELYGNKSYVEAKKIFEDLRLLGYEQSQSAYFLGLIAMSTDDSSLAVKQFEESIAADPRAADAHFYLAELLSKEQQLGAAKEHYIAVRSLQPFNETVKARLAAIDGYTRDPTPYTGDIYDMLRESKDTFAQAAVRLIDETRVISQPLRLSAFKKERLKWGIVIGAFLIIGILVSSCSGVLLSQASGDFTKQQRNGYGYQGTTSGDFNSLMDRAYAAYKQSREPLVIDLILGFAVLAIAALLFVGYRLYLRKIGMTRITIDRGVITVESGLFSSSRTVHEIYRIAEFQTEQNFFNMRTGDGALVLIQDGSRRAVIRGLMKYDDLKQLALKLRSLHLDLRSTSVNKGIMA
jgi:tetratricopeptide (TPR) repeat protein